jgi:hypothetical protein
MFARAQTTNVPLTVASAASRGRVQASAGRAGSPPLTAQPRLPVVGMERAAPSPSPLALPAPPAARRATPPARLPLSPENGTPFSISLFSISLPWGPVDPSRAATFFTGTQGRLSSAGNEIDNARRAGHGAPSSSTATA